MLSEDQIETILDAWREFESADFQYASSNGEIHELGENNDRRRQELPDRLDLLTQFLDGEIEAEQLRANMAGMAQRNKLWGFSGYSGAQFFDSLLKSVNEVGTFDVNALLREVLRPPADYTAAREKIAEFEQVVGSLREADPDISSLPRKGDVPYFLSYFWQLHDPDEFPIYYSSMRSAFEEFGVWSEADDLSDSYVEFWRVNEDIRAVLEDELSKEIHLWEIERLCLFWNSKDDLVDQSTTSSYWEKVMSKRKLAEEFLTNPSEDTFRELVEANRFFASHAFQAWPDELFTEHTVEEVHAAFNEALETESLDPLRDLHHIQDSKATELLRAAQPDQFAILNKKSRLGMEALGYEVPVSPVSNEQYHTFSANVAKAFDRFDLRSKIVDVTREPIHEDATPLEIADYAFHLHVEDDIDLGAEQPDPTVYQCPINQGGLIAEMYRRTVLEGVPRETVKDIRDVSSDYAKLRLWGNRDEEAAAPGDYILFADRDGHAGGEYSLLGRIGDAFILEVDDAKEFAEAVGWEDSPDEPFSHVMVLDQLLEANLDREEFWDLLGYRGWPNDTHSQINFDRRSGQFSEEYDSISEFLGDIKGQQIYPPTFKSPYWQDEAAKKRKLEVFLSNPTAETFEQWLESFSWYVSRYRESTVERLFDELSPDEMAELLEAAAESGEIDQLLELPGFGISAVSEALAVISPDQFAILNKDAAEALAALNFDRPNPNTDSAVRYKEFLEDVKEVIEQYPLRELVDDVPSGATDFQVANYAFHLHSEDDIDLSELLPDDPLSELTDLLEAETNQEHIYRQAAAHLVAGKNVVYYGPPGTGKTRAANLLSDALCASTSIVTANAEWSNYQVVGGYRPAGDSWDANPGFLTQAADRCTETLRQDSPRPSWLIIDELNRANLDQAFGDVFTLLDLDYRTTEPLSYAGTDVYMPLSFRILATMNTYDQSQLFSLGYAFRRRFAFVRVPSLLETDDREIDTTNSTTPSASPTLDSRAEELVTLIETAAIESMSLGAAGEGITPHDNAVLFPEFANVDTLEEALTAIREDTELQTNGLTGIETLVHFCREITRRNIIDIGQALLIDATQYLIAHQLLFPEQTTRATLDDAVVAYIVPQFEHFMADLRRAETINQDSDAGDRFESIIQLAKDLSLPETATILTEARDTKRLLS